MKRSFGVDEKYLKRAVWCVALISILFGVLIGFLICCVGATPDEYTFEDTSSYSNSWDQHDDGHYNSHYSFQLRFQEIEYYSNIDWLFVDLKNYEIEAGSPAGAQTPFNMTVGGVEIGSGTMTYSKMGGTAMRIYWFFDAWDIGGLTGLTKVVVNYHRVDFYDLHVSQPWQNHASISYDNTESYAFHIYYFSAGYGDVPLGVTQYKSQFTNYWRTDISKELVNSNVNLNITKNISSVSYWSKCVVSNPSTEFLNESEHTDTNISIVVYGCPLCVRVVSYYGGDYEHCYECDLSEHQIYGYVFDASNNFGIEGAFVEFQGDTMTTLSSGYYLLSSDVFGDIWLNVSKNGYQNSTHLVDYQGSTNLNVYMVKNETVNPGTCTIAGMIYDVDLFPVDDVYVKIYNETWSTYVYTSAEGYFVFYDLTNTTYSLSAEHSDYLKQQKEINLTTLDTAYYYIFTLLKEGAMPGVTPTATPKPPVGITDGLDDVWGLLGLGEWSGLIYAMVVIGGVGLVMGLAGNGSALLGGIGCFFGFILSVVAGWIPVWVVALTLVGAALLISKTVLGGDRG